MSGISDNKQFMFLGNLPDLIVISRLTAKINGHDHLRLLRDLSLYLTRIYLHGIALTSTKTGLALK